MVASIQKDWHGLRAVSLGKWQIYPKTQLFHVLTHLNQEASIWAISSQEPALFLPCPDIRDLPESNTRNLLSLKRWSINARKVVSSSLLQKRNTSPELLSILLLSITVFSNLLFNQFELWIKIQRKLEILDLNLGGILHRYLDRFGNLLLHFSHLATVALPGPVSSYPPYNKILIKPHQRYLSRQNQAGATVRNEAFDVFIAIVLSPTAARSTEQTRVGCLQTPPLLPGVKPHISLMWYSINTSMQLGQLTIATAVVPLPGVLETALLLNEE